MSHQIRFYWDIYFILNFIMNLFLLQMTGIIRRKRVLRRRICLAALVGSAEMTAACLMWLQICLRAAGLGGLPWQGQKRGIVSICLLAVAFFVAGQMLWISFREKQWLERWRNFFSFIQVSILTGGALLFCREWIGRGLEPHLYLIVAGTAGVCAVLFCMERMIGRQEQQKHVLDGMIYMKEGEGHPLRVLIDTGNQLVSPYSGERVMILSEDMAKELGLPEAQNPLYIPFHSIGGDGVLPAYRIPSLVLQNGSERKDFLAAVSPELSADPTIQMILCGPTTL